MGRNSHFFLPEKLGILLVGKLVFFSAIHVSSSSVAFLSKMPNLED